MPCSSLTIKSRAGRSGRWAMQAGLMEHATVDDTLVSARYRRTDEPRVSRWFTALAASSSWAMGRFFLESVTPVGPRHRMEASCEHA